MQLPSDERSGKVDYIEFNTPTELLATLLRGLGGVASVDRLCKVYVCTYGTDKERERGGRVGQIKRERGGRGSRSLYDNNIISKAMNVVGHLAFNCVVGGKVCVCVCVCVKSMQEKTGVTWNKRFKKQFGSIHQVTTSNTSLLTINDSTVCVCVCAVSEELSRFLCC